MGLPTRCAFTAPPSSTVWLASCPHGQRRSDDDQQPNTQIFKRRPLMADHTSAQTTDQRDLMIDDGESTTVQTDVLREKLAEQPARATVKVGNALEF
jgi:hypothetical protein